MIRGRDEYTLAGELAGLNEWLEVTGPQGVRDHLASIGGALVARYGMAGHQLPTPGGPVPMGAVSL